jgi:hypothetical protein
MNNSLSKVAGALSNACRLAPLLAVSAATPLTMGSCCSDCGPPGPLQDATQSVAVADMNGDGRADVVATGTLRNYVETRESWVAVLTQSATTPGTFTTTGNVSLGGGFDLLRLAIANVDSVNGPDAIVSRSIARAVAILPQSIGGALQAPTNIDVGPDPVNVAAGDLNDDGAVDIVVVDGRRPAGGVKVLLHNAAAPGNFLPPINIAFDRVVTAVAIGDIDGDGRADLAVAAFSNTQGSNGVGIVSILYADPDNVGAFLPRVDFPAGAEPASIRLSDIDRDGRVDVVVSNARTYAGVGNAGVSVLLQNPNAPGALLAPASYAATGLVDDVAVADLNGDSWADLILATGVANESLAVLLQDATRPGIFLPATAYAAGALANGIAVGQLNGDALPDLAVSTYSGLFVVLNNPAAPGTFLAPTKLSR